MTHRSAQSIATALCVFVAATPLAIATDETNPVRARTAARPDNPTPNVSNLLSGVGLPDTLPGNRAVQPLSIVLVLDDTYTSQARAREVQALGSWLQTHHHRLTRISLIDRTRHRMSRPMPGAALDSADIDRPVTSVSAGLIAVSRSTTRDRLLVVLNRRTSVRGAKVANLYLSTRHGALMPQVVPLALGGQREVAIDPRRQQTLAATIARAVISVSGMREKR